MEEGESQYVDSALETSDSATNESKQLKKQRKTTLLESIQSNMSEVAFAEVDDDLSKIVDAMDASGNMKKSLKNIILETVSSLRNNVVNLKNSVRDINDQKMKLESEVNEVKRELEALKKKGNKNSVTPSSSWISPSPPLRCSEEQVLPPTRRSEKLYSQAVNNNQKKYKLTVRSRSNESPEAMKIIIKSKINPTDIKVGISAFKSLRDGRVQIEAGSKEEIETLGLHINQKCGGQLEASIHKLRNPRIVIYNIPDEISIDNAEATLRAQNPELNLENEDITPKFTYQTKRQTRNMVIEARAEARKKILKSKIKLGWLICNSADYLVANRCFRCSRYNHRAQECRGEETCPLCAGPHKMKDCNAPTSEHRCINCTTYNKYNPNNKVNENHTSLDRNCQSLQAVLTRNKQNIDY